MRKPNRIRFRKVLSVVLAIIVGVSFLPLLRGVSYAADDQELTKAEAGADELLGDQVTKDEKGIKDEEVVDMPDVDLGEMSREELDSLMDGENPEEISDVAAVQESDAPEMLGVSELEAMLNSDAAPEVLEALSIDREVLDAMLTPDSEKTSKSIDKMDTVEKSPKMAAKAASIATFKRNKKNGTLRITGQLTGDTYRYLYVNDERVALSGSTLDQTMYMTNVPVGAYAFKVETASGKTQIWVEINIYRAPGNKISQYKVYHNYFSYNTPRKDYAYDDTCGVYLEYIKAKGKKWTRVVSDGNNNPLNLNDEYTIKKLSAGKKYKARAYYGKMIQVDGKNYVLSGKENGCVSKKVSFKTGLKKLKFKSVKVKLTNVKRHSYKKYGSLGVYHGKVVYYTCKVKATVKLKKKPGVAGMYINNKKVKGNKKTYTVNLGKATTSMYFGKYKAKTYNWYKSDEYFYLPKGKKYPLEIYTYNSKKYGGYSKTFTKKPKMR